MSIKKEEKQKKKEKDKQKKKAESVVQKNVASHYGAAELARYRGDEEEVIFHLKKILQAKPNSRQAVKWMADIQYNSKNYGEAVNYFEKLKNLGDDWIYLEFYLGLSYYFYSSMKIDATLSEESLNLASKNLEEFVNKTKNHKNKDIINKRNMAQGYISGIQQQNLKKALMAAKKETAKVREKEISQKELSVQEPVSKAEILVEESYPEESTEKPAIPNYPLIKADDYRIEMKFSFSSPNHILSKIQENRIENKAAYDTRLEFYYLLLLRGYDELLCLGTLKGVDHYWYQIETVKRVLKYYRGRVLLADEVGLGKTIEACMLIKEYLLRGLVKRVLILTPSSLVSQWHEELASKFNLYFATTDQDEARHSGAFWSDHPLIIASLNVAKSKKNFDNITHLEHDLVVVDEAHHLRNRSTLNWKLINSLKKKFIFLISATPVQNNLIELFNIITLLKPGLLKTESEFRKKYVAAGKPKMPKNSEMLRQLIREVMIRNTRSLIDVKLPPRFATTIRVTPSPLEEHIYDRISFLVREGYREGSLDRLSLAHLQMRAGSSFFSIKEPLIRIQNKTDLFKDQIAEILGLISKLERAEKEQRVLELIRKKPGEKKIIFTHYLETMRSLATTLKKEGISFTQFYGEMSNAQKDQAIQDFMDKDEILLSTEVGGEGRNIQFCRTIINYDLPWNPMRIEQRIGRIHRIGQTNDVFIFNFCLKESVEEYILNILDKKINMFELVIGEIDNILGNLDEETEFSDVIMDIWVKSKDKEELAGKFDSLGERMIQAKKDYLESKELDETLLATDFEV